MSAARTELAELAGREYAYGFSTDLDTDFAPRGLSEEVIRLISAKKSEPAGFSTGDSAPTGTGARSPSRRGRTSPTR